MVFALAIKRWMVILSSFLIGVILMFAHLPFGFDRMGSLWVVLILLYWVLMMPQYIGIGIAWFVGICLDITYNVPLGEHAIGLVLITFCMIEFREKFLLWGFLKTAAIIFGLILGYQALLFLMQIYNGNYFSGWYILGGALGSAVVWPPLALLLVNCQRKFRI